MIPEVIGNLSNLIDIDFMNNHISFISDSIGNLDNLEYLRLFNNQISVLPSSIGNLNNLIVLGLAFNQLSVIPNTFCNLTNLHRLYLGDNSLYVLSPEIDVWANACNRGGIIDWKNSQDCDTIIITTTIEGEQSSPTTLSLNQNSPNPFNPNTTISYSIPNKSTAFLKIHSITGELILIKSVQGSGSFIWNAKNLASGIYISRIGWGDKVISKKMLLTR